MKRPWMAPLVPLYRAGLSWREVRLRRGWEPVGRLAWPVISVGNLSTGGSGKTPLTIALAKLLVARGVHVDVLSRGFGRASREAARVGPKGSAEQFGDEPLLIAREARVPVYVAPQRYDAGRLAEREVVSAGGADGELAGPQGTSRRALADAHILDDGFQHRQLHRDVDILLLNREDWQDALLPAGNLREALRAAQRASVIAIPAEDPDLEGELRRWGWAGPVWRLRRRMEVPKVDGPAFAFCGIARPDQFFAGLEVRGLHIAQRKAFPDHYDYTEHVVEWVLEQAKATGARACITTEKDAVRLGALASMFPADLPLKTAKLEIEIENAGAAVDWLIGRLGAKESAHSL